MGKSHVTENVNDNFQSKIALALFTFGHGLCSPLSLDYKNHLSQNLVNSHGATLNANKRHVKFLAPRMWKNIFQVPQNFFQYFHRRIGLNTHIVRFGVWNFRENSGIWNRNNFLKPLFQFFAHIFADQPGIILHKVCLRLVFLFAFQNTNILQTFYDRYRRSLCVTLLFCGLLDQSKSTRISKQNFMKRRFCYRKTLWSFVFMAKIREEDIKE